MKPRHFPTGKYSATPSSKLLKSLPWVLMASALCSLAHASEKTDYSKRMTPGMAVAVYEIPYAIPQKARVLEVVNRIRDQVIRNSSFRVFDNKTGAEVVDPAKLTEACVVDRRFGGLNAWDYTNGVIFSAFDSLSEYTGDPSYRAHNVRFYDFVFKWMPAFEARDQRTGRRSEFSKMVHMEALDHCGSITAALIKTHRHHPDARWRQWADVVGRYIGQGQFRFEDGTIARERPQARSLWTDDFYMCIPFMAQMGELTGDKAWWDDAVKQVVQLSDRLFDKERGLYDHGWSEISADCDPRFHWGRANGWALLAMAELLSVIPEDYPGRDKVLALYRAHARRLVELQDGSGLWHNLLDRSETYLETSASAMFVHCFAKGVNEGWLPPVYAPAALVGWQALETKVTPEGLVEGCCEGTTYANESSYYFHRGASANNTFFGPVLYAGAEILRLLDNPKLHLVDAKPNAVNSAIQVKPAKGQPGAQTGAGRIDP